MPKAQLDRIEDENLEAMEKVQLAKGSVKGYGRIAELWESSFAAMEDGFLDCIQQRRRSRQLSEIAVEEPTYDGGTTSTPASN